MSPTLTWLDSFQHQQVNATYFGTNAGIYDTANNTAGMSSVAGRRGAGSYALQIVENGTTASRVSKAISGSPQTLVESFYFRITATPSVDSNFWIGVAFINANIGMKATSGNLYYTAGTGVQKTVSGNWADSSWHRIDLLWNTSATPYTLDLYVDGVSQTRQVSNATTADFITNAHFGSTNSAHTLTVQITDWVRSVTAADYPIGPHRCLALIPNADGTHNWASTDMGPNTGGVASSVSTLHNEVDDWGSAGAADTTTFIQYANTTADATEYAEILLPDVTGTVWGARAVAAINSATLVANSATTRVVDGSNATVLDLYTGDQSDTGLRHQAAMVPSITSSTLINALKYRVGFPTDSNPAPYWSALMVDYAIPGDSGGGGTTPISIAASTTLTPVVSPVSSGPGGGGGGGGLNLTPSGQSFDTTAAPTADGGGGFYYETASTWAVPNNSVAIVVVTSRDGASLTAYNHPVITHGPLTFVRLDDASGGTNSDTELETWVALNITGVTQTAKTRATYTETKIGCHLHCGYFDGFTDLTGGVLSLFRGYIATGHGVTQTVPMNAPQDSQNRTFGAWVHRANELITPTGTFNTMGSGAFGTPASGQFSGFDTGGAFNQSPNATWVTSSTGIGIALEVRRNQNTTGTSWGPGTPNYQFRSGSPWERPLPASPPLHANNTLWLQELDGRVYGAGAGATSVADDHNYAAGTTIDGALAVALDSNPATTSMTVTAGTVTAFVAAGLSPPFSIQVDLTVNSEKMTVRSWGGTGNTVWTINRTHPLDTVAHSIGARVRTGKAYLSLTGGADNSNDFKTFDNPIYRINSTADAPLIYIYPKNEAPDYGTTWTGSVGSINQRFLDNAHGGTGPGARIPLLAQGYFNAEGGAGLSTDAPMLLRDTTTGAKFIAWFSEMHYYPSQDKWYCQGASIYYYPTYGIDAKLQVVPTDWPATLNGTGVAPTVYQDSPLNGGNDGHRGVNSQSAAVDWDRMWADGGVFDMHGCGMERTNDGGNTHYFPLTGSEHTKGGLIFEGTRLHIKHSVTDADISARCTAAGYTGNRKLEAVAVATMLRDYGIVASDNSGSGCQMKLENTIREGRTNLWSLNSADMQIFPFIDDWEIVQENYDPPTGAPTLNAKTIAVAPSMSAGVLATPRRRPPSAVDPQADYRIVLANRSSSGLGTPIISDVLTLGFPLDSDVVGKWGRTLNSAGTLEFQLPIDACNPTDFAPGKRELYVYRDDGTGEKLVWGGHLWVADVRFPFVRFLGMGFYEAIRHREIGDDFYKFSADSRSIAWDAIAYTQGLTDGNLGITHGPDSGPGATDTIESCAEERKGVSDLIEDLAGADTGFDFEIDPSKVWRTWSPTRGADRSASVHLDATTSIVDLSYTVDATTVENEVAGVGTSKDCDPIQYITVVDTASRAAYGLMQATVNRSDIRQDSDLIKGLATEELSLQKNARIQPSIRLFQGLFGTPSPLSFDYDLGDKLLVSSARGYATFSSVFRLLAYSVSFDRVGHESLELTLDAVGG